jgi:oxygen-dependent protoporphyrinogen oxidase
VSTPSTTRVVVVGGGIAGLVATHELSLGLRGSASRQDVDLMLCEASPRLGGHLRTSREGELLLEAGPDSLVARKPAGVELCRELGVDLVDARVTRPAAQVVRRGRLHDLPEGPGMVMPASLGAWLARGVYSPLGKARLFGERFVAARRRVEVGADGGAGTDDEDEALGDYVTRRCGLEAFDRVVEPVFGGLFTGDAARFSTRAVAPRLLELEARWGSLTAAAHAERLAAARRTPDAEGGTRSETPAAQVAPRNGMGELVRVLVARLERSARDPANGPEPAARVGIEAGVEVSVLRRLDGGSGFVVERRGRDPVCCDAVILAVPGPALSRLVRGLDPALADAAGELAYAACATIGLAYRRAALRRELRGLGCFVPRTEGTPVLAVSYASEKFPGRAAPSEVLLRVFVGGALHAETLDRDDHELVALAERSVAGWLGLDARPIFARVDRHVEGIPQLVTGCQRGLARLRAGLARVPGLFVAGSALGVYGVPDCVASGRAAAVEALSAVAGGRAPGGTE